MPTFQFDHHAAFDPAGDFESFLKTVPAGWVVCLVTDAADVPIQLLCVKNLRSSLKRRLGGDESAEPTRRVNYREIVRHVRLTRVDSAFEADVCYFEAARQFFPQTYAGMVGFRAAWFLHVDPDARFPRYVKTTDLLSRTGQLIGPIEDKHAAGRLIELVESCFDLCRYHNILVDSPNGKACAYKEMGRCPAPCDGSISIGQYRRMIEWSASVLTDPAEFIREQKIRMQAAAVELRFETAAKIKAYIDELSQLGKGPYRHAAKLEDFQFVSFQRGPRPGSMKVFLISRGSITQILCAIGEMFKASELMRIALTAAADQTAEMDLSGVERIGIVAHHLFSAKNTHGVFLPLAMIDEKSIAKAYRDVQKQALADESDEEGIVKELSASTTETGTSNSERRSE
jgi:excinuclease UvrABC nuclease subunit